VKLDRRFIAGAVAGAAATLAAIAALSALGGGAGSLSEQAKQVIERDYFRAVPGPALESASVEGMIETLRRRYHDRFSHYFDPKALAQFNEATSGSFSGVGLSVTEVRRGLRVASVIPRTPADRAGIQPGDVIVAVDGRSIAGVPAQISTARIKGPPGSAVTLRIVTASGSARTVRLKRASVEVPAAQGRMLHAGGRRIGYVRFTTFSDGAHAQLRSAVSRLYDRGARALVLDLRGNGGGLLNEAVLSASIFLPRGASVASTRGRSMPEKRYTAVGGALPRRPIAVLINHDTASAAEILTAALADHHLATVVGTRSYGKGTFQEVINLPAGGALDLTVGKYFTADGTSLLGKGIRPDVRAPDDPARPGDEGLRAALAVLARKLG